MNRVLSKRRPFIVTINEYHAVPQEPRACLVTSPNVAQTAELCILFGWVLRGWPNRPPHGTETLTRAIEPKEAKKKEETKAIGVIKH